MLRFGHNHPGGVVRYEHNNPSDMAHLYIKKFGRVDGVGHGIIGDRSKPGRKPGRQAGWECLRGWVRDNKQAAFSELLPE